jgi:hypothetical protein
MSEVQTSGKITCPVVQVKRAIDSNSGGWIGTAATTNYALGTAAREYRNDLVSAPHLANANALAITTEAVATGVQGPLGDHPADCGAVSKPPSTLLDIFRRRRAASLTEAPRMIGGCAKKARKRRAVRDMKVGFFAYRPKRFNPTLSDKLASWSYILYQGRQSVWRLSASSLATWTLV